MERVSQKIRINFMGVRYVFLAISIAIMIASGVIWNQAGTEKYSVDFVGGTDVVVKFANQIEIGELRSTLAKAGMKGAVVQSFEEGTLEFSIRLKADKGEKTGKKIQDALKQIEGNSFELLQQDFVGPIIGEQIRQDGIKAMVIALICILIYISIRFEWRFIDI